MPEMSKAAGTCSCPLNLHRVPRLGMPGAILAAPIRLYLSKGRTSMSCCYCGTRRVTKLNVRQLCVTDSSLSVYVLDHVACSRYELR
jgi:hypothetical protein